MVKLLINDVAYPSIRQDSIQINSTANDPVPTFTIRLQDDPSRIALSEMLEVIFLDESQLANPTHNLLQNPSISPYTSKYTQIAVSGGSFTNAAPGVTLTATNATGTFGLTQNTQPGLVVATQSYMLSCTIATGTLTNCNAYLSLTFLTAAGASLGLQSLVVGSGISAARFSLQGQCPTGTVTIQVGLGMQNTNATNSGSATFTSIQLEPMSFIAGTYRVSYPTPFCALGQTNCVVLPDSTSVRQYRLFGGIITKATAGNYIGNNRQWTLSVSGYGWLLQKQQLNNTWTNHTDSYIIGQIVSQYFSLAFSTAQVITGATLDNFAYAYNGTARDAFDALASLSTYQLFIDAYRTIWYQPAGYNTLGFALSDSPDGVTSFPYYNYTLDIDGTQIGNVTLVQGATNISAIEYDAASIAHYNQILNGQGTFWRTVNDGTITTTAAAQQRAIAENATYNYASQTAHLSTQQRMLPGYSVFFTSVTDHLYQVPLLVQKATLILKGFTSLHQPYYEFNCDLGSFQPNVTHILAKILRKQQVSTTAAGTPIIGLMVTESTTFIDAIQVRTNTGTSATYGMGIYGTSVYSFAIPSVPASMYGVGSYGNASIGYN